MKAKPRRSTRKRTKLDLTSLLAQLENSQLIRRADEEELAYLFKHTLTQDTACESLLLKRRRDIHRRVAAAYEKFYADSLDEYAAVLAQHYAEAGDDAKTIEYATRAGNAAARIYANTEAVAQYSLALERATRPGPETPGGPAAFAARLSEIYLKRGRALELLSYFDEAARNYDEMAARARECGDRAFQLAALVACALICAIPGSARDEAKGRLYAGQALELARELGDRAAQAKLLWILLLLNIYTGGDARAAKEYGEQSLALARELNLREQIAYTLHDIFVAYIFLEEFEQARSARLEARKLWQELHNLPMEAETVSGLAMLDFLLGELDQALEHAQDGFQMSLSIGNLGGQGFGGYLLGLVYLERGEVTQALRSFEDAIPITEYGALEGNGVGPQAMQGLIYAELGGASRAFELVHMGLERRMSMFPLQKTWLYAQLTRVLVRSGDVAAAQAAFAAGAVKPSIDDFARFFPLGAADLHFAAIELAIAQQEYTRADELLDPLLERLRRAGTRVWLPQTLFLKAQVLYGQGQTDRACDVLNEARALAETLGSRRHLWQILALLYHMESARGNTAAAQALCVQAREVMEYIAGHAPPVLRESFLNLPQVREIVIGESQQT